MAGQGGGKSGCSPGLVAALAAVGVGLAVVSVPVCGIVAAIAIPNFLKFQCKSKQSEAKTNLSGLFTAQKAFYGEYGFYTSDLVSLNWQPDGDPVYVYGFASAGPGDLEPREVAALPGYDPRRKDTSHPEVLAVARYRSDRMVRLDGMPLGSADLSHGFVERHSFQAVAVGDIDHDPYEPQLDVWTIDDSMSLRVVENDCKS